MAGDEDSGHGAVMFDASAVSVLQSVFNSSDHENFHATFNALGALEARAADLTDASRILTPEQMSLMEAAQAPVNPVTDEGPAKTARVKFMITMQDEKNLRDLGYSQAQIDTFKPQEAEQILRVGTKAEPDNGAGLPV